MLDFLENSMWFIISVKLKMDVEQSQLVILNLHKRFQDDKHFDILSLDGCLRDSLIYYVRCKKSLGL